jgi:hypothetical protein
MSITDPNALATAVRQWVHFDNLAESLNKQVANVRTLRGEYESKILTLMQQQNLQNATLKITGATLQYANRTKPTDLSWAFLEDQLHEYYKTSGKRDETMEIIEFLQKHRGGKVVEYLKKTSLTPTTTQPPTGKK